MSLPYLVMRLSDGQPDPAAQHSRVCFQPLFLVHWHIQGTLNPKYLSPEPLI
jgi:hypothetical protein